MKIFNHINIYKTLFICCFAVLCANCEGEDGDIGPAGQDATNGIDGVDGTNGTDGTDGLGFDELTQFGSITLTIEGTRPDDVAFTDSKIFRFTPLSPEILPQSNSVIVEESSAQFDFGRLLSAPGGEDFQSVGTTFSLEVTNPESDTPEFNESRFTIFQYPIISEDLTVFNLTTFVGSDADLENFNITNFNFNSETNALTFSFTLDIPADRNTTGNQLSVSGEVDVIVLRELQGERIEL
ncbi:hypothetical protein [Aquimarina mytili]|uniref:Collagen-like protein n=1 Tax=Aquimarina mytili TaxID=874423 RepID=A0A936ZVQ0_9FLAO|nr:hypothetical protein [Aquimarina mytili]MBL0682860.1 hypothetical protein [Aquimarina mytili]